MGTNNSFVGFGGDRAADASNKWKNSLGISLNQELAFDARNKQMDTNGGIRATVSNKRSDIFDTINEI